MKFLFGSRLTKKYFPDFREPNDTDWIVFSEEEAKQNTVIGKEEFHFLPCSPKRELLPNELYTLKVSHAIYDIHWAKTMSDIRFFQLKGLEIDYSFLKDLRAHWEVVHAKKNKRQEFAGKTLDNFFKDNVERAIPHDELHKLLNPTPSYLKFVVDNVNPSEELFNSLDKQTQENICFEEPFVIALERWIKDVPPRKAYHQAQQALVTRLHPLWLADYVILNWGTSYWNASNSVFWKQYNKLREEL